MKLGFAVLVAAYMLSQFYRAFLAVLSGPLEADIGATPDDLATASGLLFLVFAAVQIPVGSALDRFGPRWTGGIMLALGGAGGAFVFALATAPIHISIAMGLIGFGCAPILMAAYYIIARNYPPMVFATLAGAVIGIGSLGNLAGAAPLTWAVTAWGWRETMAGMGVATFVVSVLVILWVKDPPRVVSDAKGSVWQLLVMPALWPVFAIMIVAYAPAAGLRGLWAGPYARDVFGADDTVVGHVTLIMGLAMVAGNFAYGPLDRLLGTRKWVVFGGNVIVVMALYALWAWPAAGVWTGAALLAVVGLAGASFPMIVAHGRAFIPAHLVGRGVTLINLCAIGGVGVMQIVTGRIHFAATQSGASSAEVFSQIFLAFAVTMTVGVVLYLFAQDRTD